MADSAKKAAPRSAPMPTPPAGFEACRVGYSPQITHLVILDSAGSNGGRPTLCRLTRFPTRGSGGETLLEADLPGWSMGGGVSGPGVEQIECPECYGRLGQVVSLARVSPPGECACGHAAADHDEGECMHLCDCAWPVPPGGLADA